MWNQYGVNITMRIQEERTTFFKNEIEAQTFAARLRSYHYQVFNKKNEHMGYAVPK
jgi:hypothetical protein